MGPPGGGLFGFKFSSRPHPRKFGVKRFLVVREIAGAVSGVACFGLPPWKKFSAADSRSSHSAQEDGCSSLPCRGVLSFRSGAWEASGSETARFHHAARRGGCGVAARGARAAAGQGVADRHAGNDIFGSKCAPARRLPATPSAARLYRGDKLCYRIPFG